MPNATDDQPHGADGRFIRTTETAERDAQICRMRRNGMSLRAIAAELDMHPSSVHNAIRRSLREVIEEPASDLLHFETDRLDHLYAEAIAVLNRDHITVSNGKIIRNEDGIPLLDDGPKLAAIREARQLRESFRKLRGLDAPKPLHIELDRRIDLEAQTVADAITAALEALDLTPEQHTAALEAAQQRLLDAAPESDG